MLRRCSFGSPRRCIGIARLTRADKMVLFVVAVVLRPSQLHRAPPSTGGSVSPIISSVSFALE